MDIKEVLPSLAPSKFAKANCSTDKLAHWVAVMASKHLFPKYEVSCTPIELAELLVVCIPLLMFISSFFCLFFCPLVEFRSQKAKNWMCLDKNLAPICWAITIVGNSHALMWHRTCPLTIAI